MHFRIKSAKLFNSQHFLLGKNFMSLIKLFLIALLFHRISFAYGGTDLEKIKLQLQWKYQFQFAGFIVAKERGYYREAGLDVELLEYNNSDIAQDLVDNVVDFGVSNILIAIKESKLEKVSLLATYFQRSPLVILAQPEIKSVLDLKGKQVMMSYNNRFNSSLSILLDYFEINDDRKIQFIEPTFNLEDFIEKKVDAITAFRSYELYELDRRKIPYTIIDPVEHGFSTTAINLFASHEKIKNNPEQVKAFLAASKKGWQYALGHIDEVAQLIHEKYQPNRTLEHLKYEGKITKELMLLNLYDIGEVNKNFVLKTYQQLVRSGKIDKNETTEQLIYKEPEEQISLTPDEQDWINKNPVVTFTGDPNWLPYEAFTVDGSYIGIVAEHLKLIEKTTGIHFKTIPVSSWTESLEKAMRGDVKVISGDAADDILNRNFLPVEQYNKNPIVIVMSHRHHYVEHLDEIKDKKIAIIKDYGYTADILKQYPDIPFIMVENIQQGLNGIAEGKYDAMLATMALASYHMAEMGLHNIRVVGKTPIIMKLTLFIDKNQPLLHSIINKALKSISRDESQDILQSWIKRKYVEKTNYGLVVIIGFGLLLIVVIILLWNRRLQQEIRLRLQSERELRNTYEDLNEAQHLAKIGNWTLDLATDKLTWSGEIYRIFEINPQHFNVTYEAFLNALHPDDRDKVNQAYKKSLETKQSYCICHRLRFSDNRIKWVEERCKTQYGKQGEPLLSRGTIQDITLQKLTEIEIQESNDKFRALTETTQDFIWEVTVDGTYTNVIKLSRKPLNML
ncbi:MAG: transporter substrate-binding domain-containing protein [Methylomarinum sp.]|nr:transporter substrate-binding domain-containing protein [Methylomarinum sp.]